MLTMRWTEPGSRCSSDSPTVEASVFQEGRGDPRTGMTSLLRPLGLLGPEVGNRPLPQNLGTGTQTLREFAGREGGFIQRRWTRPAFLTSSATRPQTRPTSSPVRRSRATSLWVRPVLLGTWQFRTPGGRSLLSTRRGQRGACSQGLLRSKKTGSPIVSASISFIISCISGGGSFRSPSRAASSEVK